MALKRKEIEKGIKEKQSHQRVEFLHTGVTLLNLSLSNKGRHGGFARGRIINLVGDGSSGKTLLALEVAAQCYYNLLKTYKENRDRIFKKPKKLYIVYNNVESVMDFPLEEMYGEEFVNAVEWIQTPTIEEFGRDYTRRVMKLKEGEFLFYILDSYDSLTSEAGKERFEKSAEKDKPEDGAYGTEKAKYGSSSFFNNICAIGEGKDATLIIISQVRENIGVTFGKKHRRQGGKALDFYTHQVCWLAIKEKLKKTVKKEERTYGIKIRAKVERNKTAKPYRECDFIALFDYGLDNIESSISYLYGPQVKIITWNEEDFDRSDFVKYIEENNLEEELERFVEEKWHAVEEGLKPNRKQKFEINT